MERVGRVSRVEEDLERMMVLGLLPGDGFLPSEQLLARQRGVSRATAREALTPAGRERLGGVLADMRKRGNWVIGRPGFRDWRPPRAHRVKGKLASLGASKAPL